MTPNKLDPYTAACETAHDMISHFPGSPFSGLRSVLGSAIRLQGMQRKAAIRARLDPLLATTYYENGGLWQVSGVYRDALVNALDEMCHDALEYEDAMKTMREAQMAKRQAKSRGVGHARSIV